MSASSFSHVVRADRVPAQGKHVRIEASEGERRELARRLGIVEVAALTADLDLRPLGAGAFGVRGSVSAEVVQTDVVTLEPVRQELAEVIDVTLVPALDEPSSRRRDSEADVEDTDERDVYRDGQIDLGAIVFEHLALGLDPYPRSPGVEFSGHLEDGDKPAPSAFAALASLKRDEK